MSVIIVRPDRCHPAYIRAAEEFCRLWREVTGVTLPFSADDDGVSDLVVIGPDSVNDFLMREVLDLVLPGAGVKYGTDGYRVFSYCKAGRRVLVLAGGRGRSTLYAVYRYFEKFAGCRYYWDGDVIPRRAELPLDGVDISESPRFDYRGLRYFAHRGLHRFQAEHWSPDDWKRELDWLVKRRLNFFMLRIGMDDVWQRAFPDDVPYPDGYSDMRDRDGYNDRSDFWPLRFRGRLREEIMEYARSLDLEYPVDCGTVTHWYSRTPQSFIDARKPTFADQDNKGYDDTGRVFDFTKKENMDLYMRLTETMVNEYDKNSALFHTIGLGERTVYPERERNFALKKIACRRIAESLRERYPHSKLMLASWDFHGFWHEEDVRALIGELDPERTLLLDYTSEKRVDGYGFENWGVVGKFPWIFGLFHAYESESELRGPYALSDERLKIAADDSFCKGMVLWPELSHNDPLVLEYLCENAWSPLQRPVEELAREFCFGRYGAQAERMNGCWQKLLPFIELGEWYGEAGKGLPAKGNKIRSWYTHQDIWTKLSWVMLTPDTFSDALREFYDDKTAKTLALSESILSALYALADPDGLNDRFVLRDSVDLARTAVGRFLNFTAVRAVYSAGQPERVRRYAAAFSRLLGAMEGLLGVTDDYSLNATLDGLKTVAPVNPDFELTLKHNVNNRYCIQAAYEPVAFMIRPETEGVFRMLEDGVPDAETVKSLRRRLFEKFNGTPLAEMRLKERPAPAAAINAAADAIAAAKEEL